MKMPAHVTRHFVTIGSRQMMYRRCGEGPAVVLLHQSPKNSAEHGILYDLLSPHFTVFAPDTPGFGLSEPLAIDPDEKTPLDVFSGAIVEFMDALDLEKVGLYGIHTGASIATRLAKLYPERVHCLVANGTLVLTKEEQADMLAHYFVPFRPSWDGSHMAWLWARIREQLIFFPWYSKAPTARLAYALSPEKLHKDALELLDAGDDYRTAYRGAIAYNKADDMPSIVTPTMYVCSETDVLMQYAHRFPTLPPSSRFVPVPTAPDVFTKTRDIFLEYVPAGPSPLPVETAARSGKPTSRFVTSAAGELRSRETVNGAKQRVCLLPELGGSGASGGPWATALAKHVNLIVPDLPGTGDCDRMEDWSLETAADALGTVFAGTEPTELWAVGASAALAFELALRQPAVSRLVLCDPFIAGPEDRAVDFAPSLAPSIEGAQFLRAWQAARDPQLFWPWPTPVPAAILNDAPPPDDKATHQRAVDMLKTGSLLRTMFEASFAYDLENKIKILGVPVQLLAQPWIASHAPFQERVGPLGLSVSSVDLNTPGWLAAIPA